MPEQLQAILNKIVDWWKKINNRQRILLISIVAVVLFSLGLLYFLISQPTYAVLIKCEDAAQAATVRDLLDSDSSINYRVDKDLIFEVEQSDQVTAEMLLGQNNIPSQAYSIDNVVDGSFSRTEADKQKLYKDYLSDRFADHLSRFDFVESAKVDIDLPEDDGTILSSKEEGKAAVVLDLSKEISEEQAYAIARYVATQLGNDTTEGITVLDQRANVLYSGADASGGLSAASSKLSYREKAENLIKSQIKKALENSSVFSNIEIAMNLDINFDETEIAKEEYSHPEGGTDSYKDSESIYESSSTNGGGGVPGTDSNGDDTTYVTQDNNNSSSEILDKDTDYIDNKTITKTKDSGGNINYEDSSVSIVATRYVLYNEEVLEKDGTLNDEMTWEKFKSEHSDPVKVENVDEELVSMIQNATGFSADSITFMIYEQPEFVDKDTSGRTLSDILQIVLAVFIFALLGFVVFKSTRTAKEPEPEPELSVEALLDSTQEPAEALEDIGYTDKSETRIMIEKFVDENPEAVALLLRNWLNEDWE